MPTRRRADAAACLGVSLIDNLPQNPLLLTPTLALATIVLFQSLWGCARPHARVWGRILPVSPPHYVACRLPTGFLCSTWNDAANPDPAKSNRKTQQEAVTTPPARAAPRSTWR